MNDELLNGIAGIIVLTGVVPVLGATLTYGLGSPWHKSWLGRVMFSLFLALVVVFGIVLGRRVFGDYGGYGGVALVGYLYIWLTLWAVWLVIIVERRKPAPLALTIRKDVPMTHSAINTTAVPEIWYKAKRAVRTITQALVVLVPIVNLVALAVIGYLEEQTDATPPSWFFAALNATVVATALTMGLVARIMAVPGINAWLIKFGLGSVPASTIEQGKD